MATLGYVLAVDDTEHNVDILADLLLSRGYDVKTELDGPSALRSVRDRHPDLILLDIMMPGMDGFEFCRQLKADASTADIPVIFISALHDTTNIVKGFEVGGVDYVTKPFKQQEVLARVESQITLARQRKELQVQHKQRIHYFETLTKMREQFIRGATHDLKNPLHVVMGYAALMRDMTGAEFEATGDELIEAIIVGAQKMQALVDEMLDLAQLETASTELAFEEVSALTLLKHVRSGFLGMADEKSQTLVLDASAADVRVSVDVNRVVRALDNLVSNAIKYTPDGGTITLSALVQDDEVLLLVKDTGLGIPPDSIRNLFEPFFRVNTEAHREPDGTGLGLSIVQTIMEQHGGRASVESKLGVGSTFKLHLPIPQDN